MSTDAWDKAADVRAGRVSSVELVTAALERLEQTQPELNAFTQVFAEQALDDARAADDRVRSGRDHPPLLGLPVSVKDHIWMAGVPATNGSVALRDFVPPEDAVAVTRLREAGAVVVGKTNNPEFCYRAYTDNALYGLTRNPWDLSRTPGGSSGGAGASVAAGVTDVALGTDGGGSIRIPAAFCGVVGHKPTFGRVPKEPGFKGWKTLSVDGPLTRSVRDAALALQVLSGAAPGDDMTWPSEAVDLARVDEVSLDLRGLRVAWSADLGVSPVDDQVRDAFIAVLEVLEGLGARLEEAAPVTEHPAPLWNSLALVEGYSSEGPLLERFRDVMTPGTAEIIEAGAAASGWEYVDALHAKGRFTRAWEEFFTHHDLVLTPSMPVTAFGVEHQTPQEVGGRPVDPFFDDWCALALPANLAGLPATSVPCGLAADGLPVGLQVMGPRWADGLTLAFAALVEKAVPWQGFVPSAG
ncbi:aspartyl-tRNA(Asn)/glutamyl-tRNA(Gln) amidotransferase subunit A [Motilibacter peucedani]|uniref:Aspartyl-tRNA(Asn)/glutamyl-tRNA(Gln) amidotransferase subunit A n=1 Tax=Motilibacter peucedani TaxID=598650 RepID=A0A420XS78_9ACTN|nr:amidase [Motilibacter peucedani]RKS77736.1 aspartyl-tRNA(Asn)/glutamyl-tRNA(Gln) amidotransferase subunit A [Motilibacter peucedani]